ncbi:MAG: TraR/DksA family transcriptional regulator [Candidatus Dadabacteria bacterium]|nr:TraR/DksA family transcriptional regulator [Candidatus Dadabacteria bacterium]NIS09048.1 TraR/DksA family transcriptional regulator [Candidatus Dadabacteria bacterium]NIX15642.1 TraR/DksA family transcriptional regulator [Candidatus Dadabacteria bacterium]NIY22384.1 TraR/DksA family transcriptional regulator [Candidatus Dadabacteria bacterium]
MTEEQLDVDYYRAKLTELKKQLIKEEQAGEESTRTVELDQSKVGRLSRMDAMQSQAMAVESNRRREIRIQRIDSAMKRIEEDDFGYCTHCGLEINPKRLEFDPAVLLCIDCARSGEG